MKVERILLTCEHGGNRVPARYRHLFDSARSQFALHSHRGYDPGALTVAKILAQELDVPVIYSTVTRLLVELNKSVGHPKLFSEFSKPLSRVERGDALDSFYHPHRTQVYEHIRHDVQKGHLTLHVGVHSFTPRLQGTTRTTDIGLLYDPRRNLERRFCLAWRNALRDLNPELRVRMNYPYRGKDNGLTTDLRKTFGARQYLGVELEMNQKLLTGHRSRRNAYTRNMVKSLDVAFSQQF